MEKINKKIEKQIRDAYSGILTEGQILETIKWWNKLVSKEVKLAEARGFRRAVDKISKRYLSQKYEIHSFIKLLVKLKNQK